MLSVGYKWNETCYCNLLKCWSHVVEATELLKWLLFSIVDVSLTAELTQYMLVHRDTWYVMTSEVSQSHVCEGKMSS